MKDLSMITFKTMLDGFLEWDLGIVQENGAAI